jgi:polar amino acid transport system substrate-binding protein
VQKDDALAGQVDAKISADGKLVVGTDPSYEPNQFKQGGKIVGWDVDLGTAIAKKLGLTAEFQESKFDAILPALGARYEIGMSSFTDNVEREKVVDFVTYYSAGTQWASKDAAFDPANPCGKKVAVQTGTVQDTADLPARQKKCAGSPMQIQRYDGQDEATNAVVLGRADAVLADSPVMAGAVKKVGQGMTLVGDVYDAAPYGIAIPKTAGTTKEAILGAMKALIADGTYTKILEKWGVQTGAIKDPVINGAAAG